MQLCAPEPCNVGACAENSWALQTWCKKRFEGMEDSLDSFFKENGLTDDIDYVT